MNSVTFSWMVIHEDKTAGAIRTRGLELLGTTIDGYLVQRVIGRGGAGVVFLALQVSLGRQVALKTLDLEAEPDLGSAQRFEREMSVHLGLSHPNLVTFLDRGRFRGQPYFVMELVEGGTLGDRLGRGPLSMDEALDCLRQLALGLGYLHACGIIHRDLKPGNVLVGDANLFKITDFGLARHQEMTAITAHGELLGTLGFIAPELFVGSKASPASDMYSMGAILYQMLLRRPHIESSSILDHASRCVNEDPVPPRKVDGRIPEWLNSLTMRLLSRFPEDRKDTAHILDILDQQSIPDTSSMRPPRSTPGRPQGTLQLAGRRPSRRRAPGIVGLFLLGGVAILVAVFWFRESRSPLSHEGIRLEVSDDGLRFQWSDGMMDPIQIGVLSRGEHSWTPLAPGVLTSLASTGPTSGSEAGEAPVLLDIPGRGRIPLDVLQVPIVTPDDIQYLHLRPASRNLQRWRARITTEPGARQQWIEGRWKDEEVVFEQASISPDDLAITLDRIEGKGEIPPSGVENGEAFSLSFTFGPGRTLRTQRWIEGQLVHTVPEEGDPGAGARAGKRKLSQAFGFETESIDPGWIQAARSRLAARFASPSTSGPRRRAPANWLHSLARLGLTLPREKFAADADLRALLRSPAPFELRPLPADFVIEGLDAERARLMVPPDITRIIGIAGFGSFEIFDRQLLDPPEGRPSFWLSLARAQPADQGSLELGCPAPVSAEERRPIVLELFVYNLEPRNLLEVTLKNLRGEVLESVPIANEEGVRHPGNPHPASLDYPLNPSSWKNFRSCTSTVRVLFPPRAFEGVSQVQLLCVPHPTSPAPALARIIGILGWKWSLTTEVSP